MDRLLFVNDIPSSLLARNDGNENYSHVKLEG